jgi:hypothetical protein
MSKPTVGPSFGISLGDAGDCPSGIRRVGGAKLDQALVWNVRTYPAMPREKAQAVPTVRPKVPMRRQGAHCLVVVMKRGNARGAKGVGHQRWIGPTGNGRIPIINGRRQPSFGGTSRMNREVHVRICEGLGVKSPGSTRHGPKCSHRVDVVRCSSDSRTVIASAQKFADGPKPVMSPFCDSGRLG